MSKSPSKERIVWTPEEELILAKGIVSLVMESRGTLYALEGLDRMAHNGGDKINKKTQQLLTAFIVSHGGDKAWLSELPKRRSTGGAGSPSTSPTKKRKMKET